MRRRTGWLGGVLALLLAGSPAAADWLVTREGGRVETRGGWKVKGKLVVFSTLDGTLASLRLADVDLEASERATQEAVAAAKAREEVKPEPPRRKSVLVVTDADVGHVDPVAPAAEEKKEAAAEEPAAPERRRAVTPGNSVVVSTWQRKDLPDRAGVEVTGELQNQGDQLATHLQVTVALYDEAKEVLATGEAIVEGGTSLRPGGTARFRAPFMGTFSFAEAGFDVRSQGLKLKAAPKPEDSEKNQER